MKSIVKQVIAQLKGDDAEVVGQKILRVGDSALKTHIAQLRGDIIAAEDAVEVATENAKKALSNNATVITDRTRYVENLISADSELNYAKDNLKELKELIAFLEGKFVELNSEA